MENSYRFFENTECQYHPCHKNVEHLNCMFCYCPLYSLEHCPGEYKYIESNGKMIKECTDCTFPHKAENYDVVIDFLSNQ